MIIVLICDNHMKIYEKMKWNEIVMDGFCQSEYNKQ